METHAHYLHKAPGKISGITSLNSLCCDFVRAYLPADTLTGQHHNGEVAFSYSIGNCATGIVN